MGKESRVFLKYIFLPFQHNPLRKGERERDSKEKKISLTITLDPKNIWNDSKDSAIIVHNVSSHNLKTKLSFRAGISSYISAR